MIQKKTIKRTVLNLISILGGSVFSRGVAFLNTIIIARELDVEIFGEFSVFYFIMTFTFLLPQAFDTTYVRYAKTCKDIHDKNHFLKATIIFKILFLLLFLVFSYPVSLLFSQIISDRQNMSYLITTGMIAGAFLSFLLTISGVFQEKEKFVLFSTVHILYSGLILLLIILMKLGGKEFSLMVFINLYLVVCIFVGSLSFSVLYKKCGGLKDYKAETLKISFSMGKWVFAGCLCYFLFDRLAVIFLTRYDNLESVGIYSVSQQLLMIIALLINSLLGILLPKAGVVFKSKENLKSYVRESVFMVSLIILFMILMMFFSDFLVELFFGLKYFAASRIFQISCLGWIAFVIHIPFYYLYYSLDSSKDLFFLELMKVTAGGILLFIFVPKYGCTGAAVSVTATLFIYSFAVIYIFYMKIKKSMELQKNLFNDLRLL